MAPAAAKPVSNAPAKIPENVLKKRKTLEELAAARTVRDAARRKSLREKRVVAFKRAEKYVQEYRAAANEEVRMRRAAKKAGNIFVAAEPKVALVVRTRGIVGVAPKPKKILQLLRLRQINNAVFVRLNKATITMLRLVEPYIAYGNPNLKTVKDIIYKRGFAKVDKSRVPIADNQVIESHLGKFGVICVEDLVHEIYTCGPHFKEAANFLWPFQLSSPNGGFKQKLLHYNEGGDAGNRAEKIGELVSRMI